MLDNTYFRDNYKIIATYLSKQQALDADPRGIQQISFTTSLDGANNAKILFILEEAEKNVWDFSQGTVKVL